MDFELSDHISRTEVVAVRGVMAVEYFDAVTGKDSEFWAFSQNCYGEMACLFWCHLFKSYSDHLHYRNLFDRDNVAALGEQFTHERVGERLRRAIDLGSDGYRKFREEVAAIRDKYIAHRDLRATDLIFPRIDLVQTMFLELRDIIAQCVAVLHANDPEDDQAYFWHEYYREHTRNVVLRRCEKELEKAGVADERR